MQSREKVGETVLNISSSTCALCWKYPNQIIRSTREMKTERLNAKSPYGNLYKRWQKEKRSLPWVTAWGARARSPRCAVLQVLCNFLYSFLLIRLISLSRGYETTEKLISFCTELLKNNSFQQKSCSYKRLTFKSGLYTSICGEKARTPRWAYKQTIHKVAKKVI